MKCHVVDDVIHCYQYGPLVYILFDSYFLKFDAYFPQLFPSICKIKKCLQHLLLYYDNFKSRDFVQVYFITLRLYAVFYSVSYSGFNLCKHTENKSKILIFIHFSSDFCRITEKGKCFSKNLFTSQANIPLNIKWCKS